MSTDADRHVNTWLTLALVESLALNIELLQKITEHAPAELRGSTSFQGMLARVEVLKSTRRFLTGESEDEAPA